MGGLQIETAVAVAEDEVVAVLVEILIAVVIETAIVAVGDVVVEEILETAEEVVEAVVVVEEIWIDHEIDPRVLEGTRLEEIITTVSRTIVGAQAHVLHLEIHLGAKVAETCPNLALRHEVATDGVQAETMTDFLVIGTHEVAVEMVVEHHVMAVERLAAVTPLEEVEHHG